SFFNWNNYKPQIASAVKEALGRELRIVGDIQMSILPSPALNVKRVSLDNVSGADNREMVAFEEVEVNVEVSSLLQGKIAVKSLRLVRPIISLEVTKDGRANWDIKLPGDDKAAPATTPSKASAGSSGGLGVNVSLESLKIEEATIIYVDARSGLREEISNLTTEIIAESLNGPFRLEGKATVRKIPTTFRITAGKIVTNRPLPVSLLLGVQDTPSQVEFKGTLSEFTPDATLAGIVKARADDLAQLAKRTAGPTLPPQLAKPVNIDAEVSASATTVGVNNLSLRLGEMSFAGAIYGVLGPQSEIDIVLNAHQIDIDPLFETPAAKSPEQTDRAQISTSVTTKLPTSEPAASESFELPKAIAATFVLGVQTATYNGGVIRDAIVKGTLRDGVIRIEQISAALPGRSRFTISGALAPADGLPEFTGNVAAKSDNLR
ncbi:MAG: AsmA family protein, partial [Pseudomonadota bacterium]|nr:AsmA family protein [Pseudomonadota bacterium]